MTLAPLLNASPSIQIHAYAALTAIMLGAIQLVAPKGTLPHRTIGWTWVGLMMFMLLTAFFIRDRVPWSPFSPDVCYLPSQSGNWIRRCAGIHLLTIYLLLIAPYAALHARRHEIKYHRTVMVALLLSGLTIGGLFTMDTTRIMHAVVFGP